MLAWMVECYVAVCQINASDVCVWTINVFWQMWSSKYTPKKKIIKTNRDRAHFNVPHDCIHLLHRFIGCHPNMLTGWLFWIQCELFAVAFNTTDSNKLWSIKFLRLSGSNFSHHISFTHTRARHNSKSHVSIQKWQQKQQQKNRFNTSEKNSI